MRYKISHLIGACCVVLALGSAAGATDTFDVQMQPSSKGLAPATDIYIVQIVGNPVIAYEGDIKGYTATKPGKGKKVNPNSAHVKKYAGHLERQQDQIIQSAGGDKVYSYRYAFNGFAARMTKADAETLKGRADVANVWKDEIRQLQTDNSPTYIGLTEGGQAWSKGLAGEDIVIGIVDSGIWPEHPSFADVATPKKGNKGPNIPYDTAPNFTPSGCDFGNTAANAADLPFSCNNKLVAARCYNNGFSSGPDATNPCGGDGVFTPPGQFVSARDGDGHGSHTASTAGGNNGVPAFIGGDFQGYVSGVAPRARIAAYKVCWIGGCASSDSMAAIDQAVSDGVDVINFSIGGSGTSFRGADDIAFLFAAAADVFVATSNGNSGPGAQTTGTPAGVPWITSVGATQDSGVFYNELVVNAPGSVADNYTAVEGGGPVQLADAGPITADVTLVSDVLACAPIDPIPAGNIALASRGACAFTTKYNNAAAAGASAIIVYNDGANPSRLDPIVMSAPGTTIPGVMIGNADGVLIAGTSGVNGTLDAAAAISAANRIAGFSSRGPNGGEPDIIKPDVSAPGVAILAATVNSGFMSINGTSMASPHVAGAFALLKQAHPDWTAAMARSALMTTARQDLKKTFGDTAADPFDIGAGEILPSDAVDPGLAYDADIFDYVRYTCGSEIQQQIFTAGTCAFFGSIDSSDLNHASIGVADLIGSQTITRTVTSVANNNGNKSFSVSVDAPPGIDVSVSPSTISLRSGESASYEVTLTSNGSAVLDEWTFGSLTWTHGGEYSVRSPIAVRPAAFKSPSNVAGAGTDGNLSYDVAFGYSGDFNATMDGLAEGFGTAGAVLDGDADLHFGQIVPPGTTLARFSLFDSEIGSSNDLDLQVFGPASAGFPFVCSSGTGTSEEQCDLVNPDPGEYAVFVIDFASAPGPTPYNLWLFNLDGTNAGNSTVTAPPSAVVGTTGLIAIDWFGLSAGTRALGIVSYDDGVNPLSGQTEVMIDTQ
jgi:subtilisin family serine protease